MYSGNRSRMFPTAVLSFMCQMQMFTDKLKVFLLVSAAVLMLLPGCSRYKDVRIGTCGIESISPAGLKSVDAVFSVEVDNPVNGIVVSEIEGTVYFDGDDLGFFEAPEVTVPGKATSEVRIGVRATLAGSMNFMQIMAMASTFRPEKLTMDISMRVKVKGGLKKKISLEGVPVGDFFRKVQYESI